jgi:hypothetical protein
MPWRDPSRRFEPAEDQALRDELRDLMGLGVEGPLLEAEPTPELIALADKLRAEAQRRRNTNRRPAYWTLMAAALPVALVLGGLSVWGHQQMRRAEQLAQEVARQEREARQAAAAQAELQRARQELEARTREAESLKLARSTDGRRKGLVIPVDRAPKHPFQETQTVKVER